MGSRINYWRGRPPIETTKTPAGPSWIKQYLPGIMIMVVVAILLSLPAMFMENPDKEQIQRQARVQLEQEAVKRGVARYHPVTGVWEWTIAEKPDR